MKHPSTRLLAVTSISVLSFAFGIPSLDSGSNAVMASAAAIPSCSGNNFWGAWVGKNGATGTMIYEVAFINDGHTTCRLTGYPTIQGYRDGRKYSLAAGHLKDKLFNLTPTIVAPRMSGEMVFTTEDLCNALNTGGQTKIKRVISENSYTVSVTFPHSHDPVYVNGLTLDVACGLETTGLGWR